MNKSGFQAGRSEASFLHSSIMAATLGMGCFWSPEALFGHLPGVVRTRVGYAGGTAADPTYRQMGDHSETIQIAFDSEIVSFEEILEVFWDNHNPDNINDYKGRQYRSILFYTDAQQIETIRRVLKKRTVHGVPEPITEIAPFAKFYPAEDRHQKYYLKRYPDAMEKLSEWYPTQEELIDSTLAARLNGLAKGYTNLERIVNEIERWQLQADVQKRMVELVKRIRW
ncbi:peptide-methionine (S)-S-oxide reductase MsrA [Paenibacillus sp. FJAT-27812]|uniref:peptide-methionine (S)-S-oxide reductase MsrA n=1 Tax=Paenibacillus sp. FJAT-27812 TaxID=1684143 RepID=UPI000A8D4136|nr:peptide-methionine (S)-S-oxide reductase MsrA [Paenibacillus sp. FJAT-27812]